MKKLALSALTAAIAIPLAFAGQAAPAGDNTTGTTTKKASKKHTKKTKKSKSTDATAPATK